MKRSELACVSALAIPNIFYLAAVALFPAFKTAAETPWFFAQSFLCILFLASYLLPTQKISRPEKLLPIATLGLIIGMHIYVVGLMGPTNLFSLREPAFMTSPTMAILLQTIAIFMLPIARFTAKLRV